MGLHLTPFEERMDPPDYDDPLDRVMFPRERKPWKRDRHTIRSAMQGAINQRCWANMDSAGHATRDHSRGFAVLNMARHEIRRYFLIEAKHQHPSLRAGSIARLRRYILWARDFDKPPLP